MFIILLFFVMLIISVATVVHYTGRQSRSIPRMIRTLLDVLGIKFASFLIQNFPIERFFFCDLIVRNIETDFLVYFHPFFVQKQLIETKKTGFSRLYK